MITFIIEKVLIKIYESMCLPTKQVLECLLMVCEILMKHNVGEARRKCGHIACGVILYSISRWKSFKLLKFNFTCQFARSSTSISFTSPCAHVAIQAIITIFIIVVQSILLLIFIEIFSLFPTLF